MRFKMVAAFHHGEGTEVKFFYYEGTFSEIQEKIRSKVAEGWHSCGAEDVSHVPQILPQVVLSD